MVRGGSLCAMFRGAFVPRTRTRLPCLKPLLASVLRSHGGQRPAGWYEPDLEKLQSQKVFQRGPEVRRTRGHPAGLTRPGPRDWILPVPLFPVPQLESRQPSRQGGAGSAVYLVLTMGRRVAGGPSWPRACALALGQSLMLKGCIAPPLSLTSPDPTDSGRSTLKGYWLEPWNFLQSRPPLCWVFSPSWQALRSIASPRSLP